MNTGEAFLTVDELAAMWRPLSAAEMERAEVLLPLVSDELRFRGSLAGRDLDEMAETVPGYGSTLKNVTAGVMARILRQATTGEAVSQESQSALGYSWSGTYAVPGGGISGAIMKNDLKALGLRRQRIGVIPLYDPGNHGTAASEDGSGN